MEMAGVEAGSTTGDGPASQQGGSGKGGAGRTRETYKSLNNDIQAATNI
jgi:hypothetical protein